MKSIQRLLFTFLFLLAMTACQPSLKEFQPEKDSLFDISFSYPASWSWEEKIPYDDLPPSAEPPPSERIVVKNKALSIQVYKPSDPQAQMQEWMTSYLGSVATTLRADTTVQIEGYNARWLTVVYPSQSTNEAIIQENIYLPTRDRFYIINFSTSRKPDYCPKDPRKQGCGRRPAPLFSDFSKLFRDLLNLNMPESEKNERFHKGFEELIKTIKIRS